MVLKEKKPARPPGWATSANWAAELEPGRVAVFEVVGRTTGCLRAVRLLG